MRPRRFRFVSSRVRASLSWALLAIRLHLGAVHATTAGLPCDRPLMRIQLQEDVPGVLPGWGTWAGQQREPQWVTDAKRKAAQ